MLSFSRIVKQHNKSLHRNFTTLRFVKPRELKRYAASNLIIYFYRKAVKLLF